MKAMRLHAIAQLEQESAPLALDEVAEPEPGPGEILIEVTSCGVCHTELDEIEGRTPPQQLPVILGHQIVGRVTGQGEGAGRFQIGDRVGIAWIHSACGRCHFCRSGRENLCPDFVATGRDVDGGYAEYTKLPEDFAHALPDALDDRKVAPLLCAGAIGYRSLRLCNLEDGCRLGLTGFGASAHLVLKLAQALYPETEIFVFARSQREREFATELGADWTGTSDERTPVPLDAIIDTTPAWSPVVDALANLAAGGRLVINAIRKRNDDREVLASLDYTEHLWLEKEIKTVANLTRKDVREFLLLAAKHSLEAEIEEFELEEANRALHELASRRVRGAKVLRIA